MIRQNIKSSYFTRKVITRNLFLVLAASYLIILSQAASSEPICVKSVFKHYCLGGSIESLIPTLSNLEESSTGELTRYRFTDQKKIMEITTKDGTIVEVVRFEPPGSWINYTAWKVKLIRLYGRGEEISHFPNYASSRSSKLNAIVSGRGHAEFAWPQTGWTVSLIWDTPTHVILKYTLSIADESEPENSEGL